MNENDFLLKLQLRAAEQEKVMNNMPFAKLFTTTSVWLGTHPWRLLIPLAFIVTVILQLLFGSHFDYVVLRILGGK